MSLYENYYVNENSRIRKSDGIKPETHDKSIILKRATSMAFKTANPILKDGQPALETDTKILKVGDGKTKYNDLKAINESSGDSGGSGSGGSGGSDIDLPSSPDECWGSF